MNDRMTPIPFGDIMNRVLLEKNGVFSVGQPFHATEKTIPLFGEMLEVPLGVAAGPGTQLAQNIIAAYYAGARFFELKTVQTLDGEDLPVAKPCINAADECYNVEWSTELRVPQAFGEYVKAWFALKLLSRELNLGASDGFQFNMSVGYDLAGIQSEKIDTFIEGMKDASHTPIWAECRQWALDNLARFQHVDAAFVDSISPAICTGITLSTLHGCPPEEIERIASYLIAEKGLHTFVKCNPTLLGYDYARETLDEMGYDYIAFDDHHFREDLQFEDAVPMLRRLRALADGRGLTFGVKLTNTFPVDIRAGELPGEEMYMSGRALFPLSIAVARRISEAFGGEMPISYSGGADAHNICDLFQAGIYPITVATTILKSGGYQRLGQMAELLAGCSYHVSGKLDTSRIAELARAAIKDAHYRKPIKPIPARKNGRPVPLLDCFLAPCKGGCPIGQDIPEYIRLTGEGRYTEALEVILDKNPLPFITGTICPHNCANRCRRSFYGEPISIRGVKRMAAEKGIHGLELPEFAAKTDVRVAIIGGGPAGMAASFFLQRAGVQTTIFERRAKLGGVVRYVIPDFRISESAIDMDAALLQRMGAEIRLHTEIRSIQKLHKEGYSYVILANGAWKSSPLPLEGANTIGAIAFLERFKSNPQGTEYGENIAVIGGGNTAMDTARAAKRIRGVKNVYIVYRRDKRNMPADEEELALAQADGVIFLPLLSPESYQDGALVCRRIELGAPDASGRRRPVPTEETVSVAVDTVITAIGEKIDEDYLKNNGITVDERGSIIPCDAVNSIWRGLYVAGDGATGPATVVEAIAGARRAAEDILAKEGIAHAPVALPAGNAGAAAARKGVLLPGSFPEREFERCLECDVLCESCVDVCPNRANIAIDIGGGRMEILHVDRMCNECGNCTIFCPFSSSPYLDKFTLFHTEAEFASSSNAGFLVLDRGSRLCRMRLGGTVCQGQPEAIGDDGLAAIIHAVFDSYAYLL